MKQPKTPEQMLRQVNPNPYSLNRVRLTDIGSTISKCKKRRWSARSVQKVHSELWASMTKVRNLGLETCSICSALNESNDD